eukprot:366486-Chlamydomonas_euryale.AAC.3
MDSPKVVVLDIRYPTLPIAELQRHQGPVNALSWAPHSSAHICTAGDDSQVRMGVSEAEGGGSGMVCVGEHTRVSEAEGGGSGMVCVLGNARACPKRSEGALGWCVCWGTHTRGR